MIFGQIPAVGEIIFNQYRYRLSLIPTGFNVMYYIGNIGKICKIMWIDTDVDENPNPVCGITFNDEMIDIIVPINCLQYVGA